MKQSVSIFFFAKKCFREIKACKFSVVILMTLAILSNAGCGSLEKNQSLLKKTSAEQKGTSSSSFSNGPTVDGQRREQDGQKNQELTNNFRKAVVLTKNGSIKPLKKLIEKSPELISYSEELAETLLAMAVVFKQEKVVEYLISKGASVDLRDQNQISILQKGIQESSKKIALNLIKNSTQINSVDQDGWSPLFYGIRRKDRDIVKALLEKRASPYFISKQNETVCDLIQADHDNDQNTKAWQPGYQFFPFCHSYSKSLKGTS